jgi:hypothetical protein
LVPYPSVLMKGPLAHLKALILKILHFIINRPLGQDITNPPPQPSFAKGGDRGDFLEESFGNRNDRNRFGVM